jgi:hypothetical protein
VTAAPPGRARHPQHARGRLGADHIAPLGRPLGRDAAGQPADAAAQIEHRPAADLARQAEIEIVPRPPGIEVVVDGCEQGVLEEIDGFGHPR